MLSMYSSWEEALNKNIWLIIGDNGHATTGSNYKKTVIDLRTLLKKNRIARIDRPISKKDEVAFCVNQRMAYIYLLKDSLSFPSIIERLKKDHRIDIIAYKQKHQIHVCSGTQDGELMFYPGGIYQDEFHQSWHVQGNLQLLDLKRIGNKTVFYGDFPDAMARLYGALQSHSGRFLVVNAKPGYEFKAQSTPFHLSGAAHGSLHRQESLVPLIIAGTHELPQTPRLIDLKAYILKLVGNQ